MHNFLIQDNILLLYIYCWLELKRFDLEESLVDL